MKIHKTVKKIYEYHEKYTTPVKYKKICNEQKNSIYAEKYINSKTLQNT